MITFRRTLLDEILERAVPLMRGRVLDVGGRRRNPRGAFRPPLHQVASWRYLNPDAASIPDCRGMAESIPLSSDSVDTIVMTEVLQYVESPRKVLAEVRRVLSPGGICLVSVPFLIPVHGDFQVDRRRFTALILREMFDAAGFSEIDIVSMGALGSVLYDLLHVAFGYALEGRRPVAARFMRGVLAGCRPLFGILDRLSRSLDKYITTGYFVTARKGAPCFGQAAL